ncbi:MAG: hypothetical protein QOJ85_3927 [Solirubrobacteraceae bacterium]|jgi:hypothetical protein|nr:hypothetical protein [Solirubrobacteraceae bacterium]
MATTLVLEARYGGGRLELTPVPHPHDAAAKRPAWQARLTGRGSAGHAVAGSRFDSVADTAHGLVAEMVCPESPWEDQALHEFFDELYEERQGWDGEKSWVSQHEHLTLKAAHDYVNTVKLRIELRGIADPQWLAVVTLPVDPGVFHRIGANAKLFGDQLLEGEPETESA